MSDRDGIQIIDVPLVYRERDVETGAEVEFAIRFGVRDGMVFAVPIDPVLPVIETPYTLAEILAGAIDTFLGGEVDDDGLQSN